MYVGEGGTGTYSLDLRAAGSLRAQPRDLCSARTLRGLRAKGRVIRGNYPLSFCRSWFTEMFFYFLLWLLLSGLFTRRFEMLRSRWKFSSVYVVVKSVIIIILLY